MTARMIAESMRTVVGRGMVCGVLRECTAVLLKSVQSHVDAKHSGMPAEEIKS